MQIYAVLDNYTRKTVFTVCNFFPAKKSQIVEMFTMNLKMFSINESKGKKEWVEFHQIDVD